MLNFDGIPIVPIDNEILDTEEQLTVRETARDNLRWHLASRQPININLFKRLLKRAGYVRMLRKVKAIEKRAIH